MIDCIPVSVMNIDSIKWMDWRDVSGFDLQSGRISYQREPCHGQRVVMFFFHCNIEDNISAVTEH